MTARNIQIHNNVPSNTKEFLITFSNNQSIATLRHPDDVHKMNWVGDNQKWGETILKVDLDLTVRRQLVDGGKLKETYTFTNNTLYDIFVQKDEIGIYTTFPDQYDSADICKTQRSHAHIWCGGEASYIMGLRMGGFAPHLGLVLTEGSIENYSIERDITQSSNNRGNIILHPAPIHVRPGASYVLEWELFWHEGKENFYTQLLEYPHYIHVESDQYVLFPGEKNRIVLTHSSEQVTSISIARDGRSIPYKINSNQIIVQDDYSKTGEYNYTVSINDTSTYCKLLVLPALEQLVKARCEFIVNHQQYHDQEIRLNGAYLIYDNEDNRIYYSHYHDHNGGRERFGMGVLLAKHLQTQYSEELEQSLLKYIDYIERELFDVESGMVYNDIGRNNDIHRLYNYSWLAILYLEMFNLYKNQSYLVRMSNILHSFYVNGGDRFYPIELPMYNMIQLLRDNEMSSQAESLYRHFQKHVDFIFECGTSYPPSEVNYEQTIVAAAANILIQMYRLSEDEKYMIAFREHLKLLELFNGKQPDYNLHEVAIRHWDGYWFGKRKLYGDTFPHYWSGLSGRVYSEYAAIVKDESYDRAAELSFRGVLSLFQADGRASCARLFPLNVNDIPGKFDDPWANDQDWALYFMLS